MRKFLIPMIAAASVIGVAAPASAQYAPVRHVQPHYAQSWAPPVYNYQVYNYGNRFNGFNFARTMQQRVQRIRGDVRMMQSRRVLSYSEARGLDRQAVNLERRIAHASRNGVQPWEARNLENGIRNLEVRVAREANDRNRRYGHRYGHRRY